MGRVVVILLSLTLLQGCATAVRTTRTGVEQQFHCLPPRGKVMLPLVTTSSGFFAGGILSLIIVFAEIVAIHPKPDSPPLAYIGGGAGLVVGLATVAVTPECPKRIAGPGTVDSASFGPPVRIVLADAPLFDGDARVIRRAGQRDVMVFSSITFSARGLYLALHQLDDYRRRTGDRAFRDATYPFRQEQMEVARAANRGVFIEDPIIQAAELRQADSVFKELMRRRSTGPTHDEPRVGAGVYLDLEPLRHRRVVSPRAARTAR